MIKPGQPAPALSVPTVGGGVWRLSEQTPDAFTMIVAYRGYHCPICGKYLADLDAKAAAFADLGVQPFVVSCDNAERAALAKVEWPMAGLTVGYDLSIDAAREWGLYISSSRGATSVGVEETALFAEPGLFLVRPDGALYSAHIQTTPFARPPLDQLLGALSFILEKNYPPRGLV